jgi:hypothetical protein
MFLMQARDRAGGGPRVSSRAEEGRDRVQSCHVRDGRGEDFKEPDIQEGIAPHCGFFGESAEVLYSSAAPLPL